MRSVRSTAALALLPVAGLAAPAAAQCEVTELIAAGEDDGAQFGFAVAVDGDRALVGSNRSDAVADNAGAAYVFERRGGGWVQVAQLLADDAAELDRFGVSVALDGDVAAVGARYDQEAGYGTGAVYVFERAGERWTQTAKLTAADLAQGTLFGTALAADGAVLVVGAELAHGEVIAEVNVGAAYVFERRGGGWAQTAKLKADAPATDDHFGVAVALHGDRLAVGAHETDALGAESGAVHVFERTGGAWLHAARLLPSDGGAHERFGIDVALDGETLLVGALLADGTVAQGGAAYVFEHLAGGWTEAAKLLDPAGATGDFFGGAVALDGGVALVGVKGADGVGPQSGSALVFVRNGPAGSGAPWLTSVELVPGDSSSFDEFGHDVALDGGRALVGARHGEDGLAVGVGTSYVYEATGAVFRYGTGCAGSGGFVPELFLAGCPLLGDEVTLTIDGALGGSLAILILGLGQGSVPLGASGCAVEAWPLVDLALALPLGGAGPGAGSLAAPATIPADLFALTFTMQAFVADPGAPSGRAASAGVQVSLAAP